MSDDLSAPQFHILLLEDNDADVYLFKRALEKAGVTFSLTILSDGEEGLVYARRQGKYAASPIPDLAVLDMNLPKSNGTTVLEALRENNELSHIPIAMMTSSAAPREQARAKELGVSCFLTKPADLEKFLDLGLVLKEVLLQGKAGLGC